MLENQIGQIKDTIIVQLNEYLNKRCGTYSLNNEYTSEDIYNKLLKDVETYIVFEKSRNIKDTNKNGKEKEEE